MCRVGSTSYARCSPIRGSSCTSHHLPSRRRSGCRTWTTRKSATRTPLDSDRHTAPTHLRWTPPPLRAGRYAQGPPLFNCWRLTLFGAQLGAGSVSASPSRVAANAAVQRMHRRHLALATTVGDIGSEGPRLRAVPSVLKEDGSADAVLVRSRLSSLALRPRRSLTVSPVCVRRIRLPHRQLGGKNT